MISSRALLRLSGTAFEVEEVRDVEGCIENALETEDETLVSEAVGF